MSEHRALLIVGPSWVGDMVMAQSLYIRLRDAEPDRAIDVLAPAWSLPLLARMPEVRSGIELPLGHGELGLGARRRLGRSLKGRYDRAIVLPRSMKSALVPWFARVPVRTGFRGEWRYGLINDMRPFDPIVLDRTVRRFVALGPDDPAAPVPPPAQPSLVVDRDNAASLARKFSVPAHQPIVALMPGAEYGPAKQWPIANFARLAGSLAANGAAVVILGSGKERPIGERIATDSRHRAVIDLCGETSLVDAIDLLGLADAAVSNDSGLMHIAAAVGTHVVAIYGSSTPAFTPPLTDAASVHYLGLTCSPCFARECPLGHLNCLHGIAVGDVERSVRAVLDASSGREH